MKTNILKANETCAKTLKQLFFLRLSHLALPQPLLCQTITHVHRVTRVGLDALAQVINSKRYTAGVTFLFVIAPLSSIFYLLFNPAVVVKNWYYVNHFYLFYTLSSYLMLFFASIGTFLLFPVKCKTSYLATIGPIAYSISKIIYLTAFVHSNEQFLKSAPWFIIIIAFGAAIGFLYTADYLLYRKYHLLDGTKARIIGLIKSPGIDDHTRVTLLQQQVTELENFNQRF